MKIQTITPANLYFNEFKIVNSDITKSQVKSETKKRNVGLLSLVLGLFQSCGNVKDFDVL